MNPLPPTNPPRLRNTYVYENEQPPAERILTEWEVEAHKARGPVAFFTNCSKCHCTYETVGGKCKCNPQSE